jgi:hypothetical protein
MNVPASDDEQPVSWRAIAADTPVFASDGSQVGKVREVLGGDQEDIFHGVVVDLPGIGNEAMLPAAHVVRITDQRIESDLTAEEIKSLPEFEGADSFRLGNVGLFGKSDGWVKD